MKQFIALTISGFILLSCNSAPKKVHNPFFDFDAVDHYSIICSNSEIEHLYEKKLDSELDSLKFGVILDDMPRNISDLEFIPMLEPMGYTKTAVDKAKFNDLNELFSEKPNKEKISYSCIYIYRDILVFKKRNKVIGTVKICFECKDNQIKGAKYNAENFGNENDLRLLQKILSHKVN